MTEKKRIVEKILEEYRDVLRKFDKWISTQSHLPQNINKLVLIRYLQVCDHDLEKAKELLEINVKFRSKYPHIFTNRDVESPELQKTMNTVQVCPLPQLTKEKFHITAFRLINTNSNNFIVNDTIKWILMVQDMLHMNAPLVNGDICIFDAKDFSIWHFMKFVTGASTIRLFMRYVQDAVALRNVQNHFVNCSPVLSKLMVFLRPFIDKELNDAMHFHTLGFESLYEFVPKENLPYEYGGSVGALDEIYKQLVIDMHDYRDYLNDDSNLNLVNE